jgi:uncharacterized sulfatase
VRPIDAVTRPDAESGGGVLMSWCLRIFRASLLVSLAVLSYATPSDARPNIIFIMADDHPWPVYGFMKAIQDSGTFPTPTQHPDFPPIQTPNLDRLAARGAVFPVGASAQSKCIPSYRSLLTGTYPIGKNRGDEYSGVTIPEYLARVGYISYGFGKMWSTFESAGFTHGGVRDWDLPRVTLDPIWSFLDARDEDGPSWFIWYAPRLPHEGYDESVQYRQLFPESLFSKRGSEVARKHYANVMLLDFWIGQLLDGLETRGLNDNTLIVFMSDNGYLMRNSKDRSGENGVRTPVLVSLPNAIPPQLVLPQMIHAVDVLPTLLDYAGSSPPAGVDGESMQPYFNDPSLPGREFLFSSFSNKVLFLRSREGLRYGLRFGHAELYDLTVDPDEYTNLASLPAYRGLVPALQHALGDLNASVTGARE